jgi:uridine kinase
MTTTDFIINTSLPYELPIYAARMSADFAVWNEEYRNDPLREDASIRAQRVYNLLNQISPVEDESSIPTDSVLREFIGGSCYEY